VLEPCPGGGLRLEPHDGPTHPYIGASPACWALFGSVLAREYEGAAEGFFAAHRLTVDTYAVQHPGAPERRSAQSVGIHLVGLHLALESGVAPEHVTRVLARATTGLNDLRWLEPPANRGEMTVADVAAAETASDHVERVREWASDVWHAWSPHHDTVRAWSAQVMRSA
jgi:hypothetical protein